MKHSRQLGGTAGCSLRLIEASEYCGSCEEQRQDAKMIGKREVNEETSILAVLRLIS